MELRPLNRSWGNSTVDAEPESKFFAFHSGCNFCAARDSHSEGAGTVDLP